MNIFVSSPQAQVGKTFVSAGLAAIMQALGYQCAYHKPIQLGADDKFGFLMSPDVTYVKASPSSDNPITIHLLKNT